MYLHVLTGSQECFSCHTEFITREPSPMNGTFSIVSIGLTHPFRISICGRILAGTLPAVHDHLHLCRAETPHDSFIRIANSD
jgi:hypothetical protein